MEHKQAFDLLKNPLAREVVLGYPDFSVPFEIYTDTSKYQINWIRHYSKGQATCILFQETHRSSNEIQHCDRTRTSCDSGNTSWVQVYSPWTFDYNLHGSQEPYLFKFHYRLRHSLAIDCWRKRSQNCLPSRQMQAIPLPTLSLAYQNWMIHMMNQHSLKKSLHSMNKSMHFQLPSCYF